MIDHKSQILRSQKTQKEINNKFSIIADLSKRSAFVSLNKYNKKSLCTLCSNKTIHLADQTGQADLTTCKIQTICEK